jgi:hypothetical protein
MSQPTLLGKLLSPAGFGLVVLMFFLPFVAVSCGAAPHQVTATFNGLDMVNGHGPVYSGPDIQLGDQANLDGAFQNQYDNEPLALLAAVVVLGGMVTVFIGNRRTRHIAGVVLAGLAAGLVLAAEIRAIGRLNHIQVTDTDGRVVDLNPVYARPQIGFYLAVGLLFALVVGHAITLYRPAAAPIGPADHSPPEPDWDDPQAWARPPIWADDDGEQTTIREADDPAADAAYREWIDQAWPTAPPPRPTSE